MSPNKSLCKMANPIVTEKGVGETGVGGRAGKENDV